MAAALVQRGLSALGNNLVPTKDFDEDELIPSDVNTDDTGAGEHSLENESPQKYVDSDSDSDEELQFSSKKLKKKVVKVLTDESDDEDEVDKDKSEINGDFARNEDPEHDNEKHGDESEDDKTDASLSKKSKKKSKIVAFSDDSETEADMPVIKNSKKRKSRRQEKEEITKSSQRGSAMKKLLKSRKKKQLKTFAGSGDENSNSSESENDSNSKKETVNADSNSDFENVISKKKKSRVDKSKKNEADKPHDDGETAVVDEQMKSESEFSDSDSDNEDVNFSDIKKTYGTRRKTVEKEEEIDEDERNQQLKTEKILENKDLFDAGSDDSDDGGNRSDQSIDEGSELKEKSSKKKNKKEPKPRKQKKSELFESKSMQQKLLRDQKIKLPEHRPTDVSLLNFLQRVPNLKALKNQKTKMKTENSKPKTIEQEETKEEKIPISSTKSKVKKLLSMPMPRLSSKTIDVDLEFEDETPSADPGFTSLMQRLEKHTASTKQKQMQVKKEETVEDSIDGTPEGLAKRSIIDLERIEKASDTPGSRLQELKSQLQKGMKSVRYVNRKEAEMRHKFENEEIFEDEDEEECDDGEWEDEGEGTDKEDKENEEPNDNRNGETLDKKAGGIEENDDSEDEDDEELKRWNEVDDRKQIEAQMEEEEDTEKAQDHSVNKSNRLVRDQISHDENTTTSARTAASSLDLFPEVQDEDEDEQSLNLELKGTFQWDDTSTIPPGQGDSGRASSRSRLEASTPFSKLLNSSRRYSSASDDQQKSGYDDEAMHKDNINESNCEDSMQTGPVISDDLHFTLDENTQFSQILDTQGYFQPRRVSKDKNHQKKVARPDSSSMSQLLGLCSGNFEAPKPKSLPADDFGLPSDLPVDEAKESGSSQDFLDLCSGRFTTTEEKRLFKSPTKKVSVLSKLLDQADTQISDSQAMMDLCSGAFESTADKKTVDKPVFEESRSTGSLMKHFGEPKFDSHARKSFDNLFSCSNQGKPSDCHEPSSKETGIDHGENIGEELLELCTGRFPETKETDEEEKPKFYIGANQNSENCGKDTKSTEETVDKEEIDADDAQESNSLFKGNENDNAESGCDSESNGCDDGDDNDSDVNDDQSDVIENEDENKSEVCDGEDENDVNEELEEYMESLPAKKFKKKQFYEEEAELSGSDASDDEDIGSEADEYEIESDIEDLPSEKRIKAQVQKAHMKATMELDKQNIRLIQERFYEDGDLLSDGLGRRRNFRWRNIDRPMNDTVNSDGSEGEDEDEGENETASQKETEKRKQRIEKEAFLEEQRKSQEIVILDENSQSILNIIKERKSVSEANEAPKTTTTQTKPPVVFKRQGSFLDRNKATLSRLSSFTSNHSKPSAPARSFVFQAKSSNNTPENAASTKALRRPLSGSEPPQPKKPRIDRTLSNPSGSSVFSHL